MWGANPFPSHNRLPNLNLKLRRRADLINRSKDRLPLKTPGLISISPSARTSSPDELNLGGDSVSHRVRTHGPKLRAIFDATESGDSAGDCDRPLLVHP